MKGVTKCITLTLLVLSVVYLMTRIYNFLKLKEYYSDRPGKSSLSSLDSYQKDNIELIHYFTIVHSFTCVAISIFAYMMLRNNQTIDRR
jgi:hypothetical protein